MIASNMFFVVDTTTKEEEIKNMFLYTTKKNIFYL